MNGIVLVVEGAYRQWRCENGFQEIVWRVTVYPRLIAKITRLYFWLSAFGVLSLDRLAEIAPSSPFQELLTEMH